MLSIDILAFVHVFGPYIAVVTFTTFRYPRLTERGSETRILMVSEEFPENAVSGDLKCTGCIRSYIESNIH